MIDLKAEFYLKNYPERTFWVEDERRGDEDLLINEIPEIEEYVNGSIKQVEDTYSKRISQIKELIEPIKVELNERYKEEESQKWFDLLQLIEEIKHL